MGFVDAKNKVPEYQRMYQQAYKNHTRLWKIGPRSSLLLTPYHILLWGTSAATLYAMGRRIWGKNTWFSD
ncbi:hypothetical protein VTK26DRAFT_8601 [Humicola hyalothermophila]